MQATLTTPWLTFSLIKNRQWHEHMEETDEQHSQTRYPYFSVEKYVIKYRGIQRIFSITIYKYQLLVIKRKKK